MKTSRLFLIVTGEVRATDDEAALIMKAVRVAHEAFSVARETPGFDVFYKETLKSLDALTAQTEEFP